MFSSHCRRSYLPYNRVVLEVRAGL
jgi:hypothetical protein